MMLILFDLDHTLLRSTGAGLIAMEEAGRRLFGKPITREGLDLAGRLDPLIFADLLEINGIEPSRENVELLKRGYTEEFPRHAEGNVESLAGTHELLARLGERSAHHSLTLGVLTGNLPETGAHKLRFGGFDLGMFSVRVWGDSSPHDPPHRDHLPPLGIKQFEDLHSRLPTETIIVGDTPHDVRCGLANGCRVLAVATGRTDAPTLARAGAHRVVDDLSETDDIVSWLLGSA